MKKLSAVYVFDLFAKEILKQGIDINFQCHDEWTGNILESDRELTKEKIKKAIDIVNEELKLNVTIGCSIDFGNNYKEVH